MRVIEVDSRFAAASQPETASDWDRIAASGFAVVVNNRPEGEEGGQPAASAEAAEAAARGLRYHHVPVAPGAIGEDEVARFAAVLDAAEGPVLAHCRSGMRSAVLWALASVRAGRLRADEVPALGARLGLDLRAASLWLASHPPAPAPQG